MLHVICTQFRPGHLNACVGDSLRRSEEIEKKSWIAPLNAIIIIIIIIIMKIWTIFKWLLMHFCIALKKITSL